MLKSNIPMGVWSDEMPPVNLINYPMKDTYKVDPLDPATWPPQVIAEAVVATKPIPTTQSAFDVQVGGGHYKHYKIQPLAYAMANNLNFAQGNVVKYVTRYKEKNGVEDLKKARHYIDMLIELESR
jgi:hypothetical protein